MSELSKQALKVENNQSFPNNNTGYITPGRLRDFNVNMIDSLVDEQTFNSFSQSVTQSIEALQNFSSSLDANFASQTEFNFYTASNDSKVNSLIAATASYATSAVTASSLVTASFDNGTRNLTFTKGDASTFAVNIPDVSGSAGDFVTTSSFNAYTSSLNTSASLALVTASLSGNTITFTKGDNSTFGFTIPDVSGSTIDTGSFATTGSNSFNGNQTVNGYVSASNGFYSGENTTALNIGDGSNVRFWSGSTGGTEYFNVQLVPGVGDIAFSRSGASNVKVMTLAGVAGNNTTFQNNPVVFNNSVSSLTVNAQSTAISGSGSYSLNASTISETATTAQLIASASVIGTFGLTGQSGGDGKAILLGHSGSLVIGNSQTNAYYADLAFISSSQSNANTNLVFKSNTNTNSMTVSGSANLFVPASAPTADFKRYIGGSGNIMLLAGAIPQITGSNSISPVFTNNTHQGNAFNMRTPVSSSTWTISGNTFNNAGNINFGTAAGTPFVSASAGINLTNSFIGGTISATAYKTTLYGAVNIVQAYVGGTLAMNNDSSSIQFSNASMQGTLTINNSYNAGTTTNTNALSVTGGSMFFGVNNNILASGSNTTTSTARQVIGTTFIGTANSASAVLNGDNSNINSVVLAGHSLAVTGSSALQTAAATAADRGTVVVGRFNAEVQSGNTVFAVGSGTSTSNRRNALLIDSGSNTTISGSVAISGSLTIQSGSTFFANGNRQFNVGVFQSDVTQSGSANVSQSMNFETTDISEGVSIVSNSRITLANAGTYNIQFSVQVDRVSGSGTDTVHIWLKKNGTNVDKSAGAITIAGGAAEAKTVAAWNYVVNAAVNDYYELVWQSTDTNIQLINQAATGNIPSTPSIILTVTQVR